MFRLKLEKPTAKHGDPRCPFLGLPDHRRANIAFGNITGGMANANMNSGPSHGVFRPGRCGQLLFGGGPVEAIISATGAAPHAVWSGVIMMAIMALILFFGLLPKIGKFVPSQSIAGFLFILGAFVTIPGDGAAALPPQKRAVPLLLRSPCRSPRCSTRSSACWPVSS